MRDLSKGLSGAAHFTGETSIAYMMRTICLGWIFCMGLVGTTIAPAQAQEKVQRAAQGAVQDQAEASTEAAAPESVERSWVQPEAETLRARLVAEADGRDQADRYLWLDSARTRPIAYREALDPLGRRFAPADTRVRGVFLSISRTQGALEHGHLAQLRGSMASSGWHSYQAGLAFDPVQGTTPAAASTATLSRVREAVAFVQSRHPSLPLALLFDHSVGALGSEVAQLGSAALVLLNPGAAAFTGDLPADFPVLALWVAPARAPTAFAPSAGITALTLPKSSSKDPASLVLRRVSGWAARQLKKSRLGAAGVDAG